jgi:CubicO group peptidase (beta-lactamase class C family)
MLSVLVGLLVLGLDPVLVRTDQFVAGRKNCGVVIGIWRDGRTRVLGRGTVFLPGGARRPDGATVFEIGSVTKTLTGVLLAEAVRRGEVRLEDPAAKHLPADLAPPSADPKTRVTLEHLATHRSGLPVQPAGVGLTSRDPRNPYADFDRTRLAAVLKELEPSKKPGEAYRYSNLGAGLLGHALVRAARADSFDALLKERVCKPLGLRDTGESLTGEQRARFARGHTPEGKPTPPWDFATLEACGGVRSTAADMLTYAAACLGEPKTTLLPALREAMRPRRDVVEHDRVGLFWMVTTPEKGPRRVWHNGSTLGHRCIVILVPDQRVAVVVLCSVATREVDQLGLDLVELVCRK